MQIDPTFSLSPTHLFTPTSYPRIVYYQSPRTLYQHMTPNMRLNNKVFYSQSPSSGLPPLGSPAQPSTSPQPPNHHHSTTPTAQTRPDIECFRSPQYNSNRNNTITSTAPAPNGQGRPRLSPTGPGDCLCTDSRKPQPSCQMTFWPLR